MKNSIKTLEGKFKEISRKQNKKAKRRRQKIIKLEDKYRKLNSRVKGIPEGMKNKNKEDEIIYKII